MKNNTKDKPEFRDKRQFPRLEQEFTVYYDVVSNELPEPLSQPGRKGKAKNISGGGLYLVLPSIYQRTIKKLLNHGSKLSLEFYLPDFQDRIRVFAEVRWSRGTSRFWDVLPRCWELGVRFVYIHPETRDAIVKYVINKQIEDHLTETG